MYNETTCRLIKANQLLTCHGTTDIQLPNCDRDLLELAK